MNTVTLYIKGIQFLYSLLRNTIYIPTDTQIENIPIIVLKNMLSKHGITYTKELKELNSDIIITDDITIAKDIIDKKIILISPIDFNVIDGYVNELRRSKNENLIATFNVLDYLKENHPNLQLVTPTMYNHPNIIFDLSVVLNYNLYDYKWGAVHYNSKELFRIIQNKLYRVDYSVREVKKENRIKLLLELINSKLRDNVKMTVHDSFLHNEKQFNLTKDYFTNILHRPEYFERLNSLDKKYYSTDSLENQTYSYQEWPMNKLINHTLKSDISLYFESAPELHDFVSMDYLITEKTIDLLAIGKPFIYTNAIVEKFMDRCGFIDYNKSIFNNISRDRVELIRQISYMPEGQYKEMVGKLMEQSHKNIKKLEEYLQNNTLLERLIHN